MPNGPRSSQLHRGFATTALILLLGGSVQSSPDTRVCDLAARHAAQNSTVPLELLLAISRVETGRRTEGELRPWPWAINQGGQGHWFDTADQAVSFANDLLKQGDENFDVGCFQINLHWHSKNFSSLEDMFDPETNAAYAARFLTSLLQSEGGWPQAVAAYHSRSPDQAQLYLTKVEAALNDLRATGAVAPPTEDLIATARETAPRVNRFPLLQAGARGAAASLVPLTDGTIPLFAALP